MSDAARREWAPIDREALLPAYERWVEFIAANHDGAHHRTNDTPDFTPLRKPLDESRLALVTTAGAHLDTQEPFHVATTAGDAGYRLIPDDVDPARLRFTHTHYDTSSAEKDPNVVLPLDVVHEAVETGRLASASDVHIGMMGFNPDPRALVESTAPEVAGILQDHAVDVVLLVPG